MLTQYQDSYGQVPSPEVPQHIAQTKLWPFFRKQRNQILKDKWYSSKDAGYDIGVECAIRGWLQRNYLVWALKDVEHEDETNGSNPAGLVPP